MSLITPFVINLIISLWNEITGGAITFGPPDNYIHVFPLCEERSHLCNHHIWQITIRRMFSAIPQRDLAHWSETWLLIWLHLCHLQGLWELSCSSPTLLQKLCVWCSAVKKKILKLHFSDSLICSRNPWLLQKMTGPDTHQLIRPGFWPNAFGFSASALHESRWQPWGKCSHAADAISLGQFKWISHEMMLCYAVFS